MGLYDVSTSIYRTSIGLDFWINLRLKMGKGIKSSFFCLFSPNSYFLRNY